MLRFDLIQRAAQDYSAIVQHGNLIRNAFDFFQQMGRKKDGSTFVSHSSDHRLQNFPADDGIETRARFIEQQ